MITLKGLVASKITFQHLLKVTSTNKRRRINRILPLWSEFLTIILKRLLSNVVQIQKLVVAKSDRFRDFSFVSLSSIGNKIETIVKAQQVGIPIIECHVVHSYRMVNRVSFIGLSIVTYPCIISSLSINLL